jgi:hypothetical protein
MDLVSSKMTDHSGHRMAMGEKWSILWLERVATIQICNRNFYARLIIKNSGPLSSVHISQNSRYSVIHRPGDISL